MCGQPGEAGLGGLWAGCPHLPSGQQVVPALRPPKYSRLFVCLGDVRDKHTGLSGYWFCLFTH
jgi:hypothetical protein